MDLEKPRVFTARCFTTMAGSNHGVTAFLGWDGGAVGPTGLLNMGIALHDLS